MIEFSIAFQTDKPLRTYGELATLVEHYPFHTISVYEDLFFQPAWAPLHAIARHTKRVSLGPAVVNPYLRHPVLIAGEFALLNEAAQGRAYLGLGRGAFFGALNLDQPDPIGTMEEAVTLIRRFLHGDRTPFQGTTFQASSDAYLRWQLPYRDVRLLIGTWGPRMAALAGRVAQEVKVGGCWNPDFVPLMRSYINRGAAAAGRDPSAIGIVLGAVTVVDEDPDRAEALARREAAMYLPVVLRLDPTLQVDEEEATTVNAALARGDDDAAAAAISSTTLRRLACFGTPAQIVDQVAALAAAGVSRVEFGTPHGHDPVTAIRLLGEQVLPAFSGAN
jgi:5,10-methylenetetrahydromethanopterin reductase